MEIEKKENVTKDEVAFEKLTFMQQGALEAYEEETENGLFNVIGIFDDTGSCVINSDFPTE